MIHIILLPQSLHQLEPDETFVIESLHELKREFDHLDGYLNKLLRWLHLKRSIPHKLR